MILHMLRIGAIQVFHDPLLAGVNDIQELSKTHEIVSRAKTELWHRILTHYLPLYFPEADRYHRSSRTDWFLAFLEAFPSPHFIAAMGKEAFIAAAWAVVGRRVSKTDLLSDIYETAKTPSGCPSIRTLKHNLHPMVKPEGDGAEVRAQELGIVCPADRASSSTARSVAVCWLAFSVIAVLSDAPPFPARLSAAGHSGC